MFGFGNKKRIIELEDRVESLARVLGGRLAHIDSAMMEAAVHDEINEEKEKCFNCRIMTSQKVSNNPAPGIRATIYTNYIPAKEAIERIMDHLGIEFDHIDAKPSETVIKTKEADKP